jgi:hypothetical protein
LLCQPFMLCAYCSFVWSHDYLLRTLVSHSGWRAFSTSSLGSRGFGRTNRIR